MRPCPPDQPPTMSGAEHSARADALAEAIVALVDEHVNALEPGDAGMVAISAAIFATCGIVLACVDADVTKATELLANAPWRVTVLGVYADLEIAKLRAKEPTS